MFFYHFLTNLFSVIIAAPVIIVIEGFSLNLIQNTKLLGCTPLNFVELIVNFSMVVSLYFIFQWILVYNEDPENVVPIELWDYVHIFTLMINRAIVIAIKYGTFSDRRFEILRKIKLGLKFLNE